MSLKNQLVHETHENHAQFHKVIAQKADTFWVTKSRDVTICFISCLSVLFLD